MIISGTDIRTHIITFRIFINSDVFYCDPKHFEYFQNMKKVYHHFFDHSSPEIRKYDKYMSHEDFKLLVLSTIDNKATWPDINCFDKTSDYKLLKPTFFEKKYVTYSLINTDKLHSSRVDEEKSIERRYAIDSRGVTSEHLKLFTDVFQTNDMFKNLGDSRSLISSDEIIKKLELIQQSKMYFGSPCAWSRWADWNGIPRYHTINVSPNHLHAAEFGQISKKTRRGLLEECLN